MILIDKTIQKFNYDPTKLSKGSNKIILYLCDYCQKEGEKQYYKYNLGRKEIEKDSCATSVCKVTKQQEVMMAKYGVKSPLMLAEFKDKMEKTHDKNGGNPFAREEIKKKIKETNIKKYGVENPQQSLEIKNKTKQTMFERHGAEFPYQVEKFLNKTKNKINEKYGVDFYAQTEEFKELYSGKNKLDFDTILKRAELKQCVPLFEIEEYNLSRDKLKFLCKIHNEEFTTSVFLLSFENKQQCPKCKLNGLSKAELEIQDFIKSLSVNTERGRRDIIPNSLEIDIFTPEYKIGIEYHGLFWHSEYFLLNKKEGLTEENLNKLNKKSNLHHLKYSECQKLGISLIQIFEDEWRDKKEICKNLLKNKFNKINIKLNARDMIIKNSNEIDKNIFIDFLNKNHLIGQDNSKNLYYIGLFDKDNNIMSCVSLKKTDVDFVELTRYCVLLDVNVRGSFSKLLKESEVWALQQNVNAIASYSDCRYSSGNVYLKNGFLFDSDVSINYFYTDGHNRYPKYPFRATKDKTEAQITSEMGLYKIYDAGKILWIKTLAKENVIIDG